MNTKIIGVAIVTLVLAKSAHAVPIQYEFTASLDQLSFNTFDPVPTAIQDALLPTIGQTLTGSFFYDSEAPFLYTTPAVTGYNHAVSGLTASFAGLSIAGTYATPTAGLAIVHDGPPQDLLTVGSSISSDPLLGYALRSLNVSWVQNVPQFDPLPDFLTGNALPTELPVSLRPQFVISFFIPELRPINPLFTSNASLSAYQGTIRRVEVPEPASLMLMLGGWLASGLMRRKRATA